MGSNGSIGTIPDFLYKQDDQPPPLPIAGIVKFNSTYTEPSFLSDIPRCVPIIKTISQICMVILL